MDPSAPPGLNEILDRLAVTFAESKGDLDAVLAQIETGVATAQRGSQEYGLQNALQV
ncbi:hypothetical protein BGZ94_007814, partial [Podila epigama]